MPRNSGQSIFDVLEYGPIVAKNEDLGLIVSINGSYLNLWASDGAGGWHSTEYRSGHPDLHTLTAAKAMELGEEWLTEIERGDDDESEDDEDTDSAEAE